MTTGDARVSSEDPALAVPQDAPTATGGSARHRGGRGSATDPALAAVPRRLAIVQAGSMGVRLGMAFAGLGAAVIGVGARREDIAGTIHAYPTLGEAFQEASLRALGEALHI